MSSTEPAAVWGSKAARSTGPTQSVTSRAAPLPSTVSTALSARSWRAKRPRLAPSATRTAISRLRRTARASRRLATLAQAMSSTSPHIAASQTESVTSLFLPDPAVS